MKKLTFEEIKHSDKNILTAAEIAPIVGADPNVIRYQAQEEPDKLGFPVIVMKSRVKIPRIPFIKFMEGELYEQNESLGD